MAERTKTADRAAPDPSPAVDALPTIGTEQIDRLNLRQALLDFEVANARVVDLTGRLTRMHEDLLAARHELSMARIELGRVDVGRSELIAANEFLEYERNVARAEVATIKASRSYRIGWIITRSVRRIVK